MESHNQTLLNNFVVKAQTFQTFTLLYLTVLVYLQLWLWIKMPKPKSEEAGSLSKYERQNLQKLFTQGGAAFASVRSSVETGSLPVSKVSQFIHSKPSYTKFPLATSKFQRMKAFASINNEIWCMDLAYTDKLANDNNGVKHRLVRQDLFDRIVYAKRMKTKDSKETVRAFLTMITEKNRPTKFWIDKGTEYAGEFEKVAKLKENKFTQHWVRLRLHLLRLYVQYGPWKKYFTVTWKNRDTSTLTDCLNALQPWILEKNAR